tara:strand:+ start:436 stop:678 length:243 start_codon:yes stop_codon:yes gene_type:complete
LGILNPLGVLNPFGVLNPLGVELGVLNPLGVELGVLNPLVSLLEFEGFKWVSRISLTIFLRCGSLYVISLRITGSLSIGT